MAVENNDNYIDEEEKTKAIDLESTDLDKTVVFSEEDFRVKSIRSEKIAKEYIKQSEKSNTKVISLEKTGNISQLFEKPVDIDEHIKKKSSSTKTQFNNSEISADNIYNHEYRNIYDDFELITKLAEGGQGFISSAIDKKLGRIVAIKSLHDTLKNDTNARDSFVTEAKITSQLDHPGVPAIYEIDSDASGGLHLAMKLINGQTLSEYLREIKNNYEHHGVHKFDEKKSIRNRIEIVLKCCAALSYAHSRNVMHCDLKPDNIMIGEYGETYIMDWGIAKLIKDETETQKNKTITGTPYYFSPEVINKGVVDERSDIYTLGLILFETVFLKRAFVGDNDITILKNIRDYNIADFKHQYGVKISKDLVAILKRATAYFPENRYQTIAEFEKDLRSLLASEETDAYPDNSVRRVLRWASRHISVILAFAFIGVLLGLGAVVYSVFDRIEQNRIQLRQEVVLSDAYSKNLRATAKISFQMSYVIDIVKMFVSNIEFLKNHDVLESAGKEKLYLYGQRDSLSHLGDKSFYYNDFYKQYISEEKLTYFNPEKVPAGDLERRLDTFQLLLPRFKEVINNSNVSIRAEDGKTSMYSDNIKTGKVAIMWVYYVSADGLFCIYPGYGNTVKVPDMTQRPWYQLGKKNGTTSWGTPYLDFLTGCTTLTCSHPVIKDGEVVGVFGADLLMGTISKLMEDSGVSSEIAINKMLVDSHGEILIQTRNNYKQEENSVKGEAIMFPDEASFNLIAARKNGYLMTSLYGRKCVYIFNYIEPLKWFYVELLNYDKLMLKGVE